MKQSRTLSKSSSRYIALSNQLAERIRSGVYNVGDKLPNIHQLCQEFGASYVTVQRAVKELNKTGYVKSTTGKRGTVIISSNPIMPEQAQKVACFFRPLRSRNNFDNFGLDLIYSIREEMTSKHLFSIDYNPDNTESIDNFHQAVRSGAIAAILLDNHRADAILPLLKDIEIPVVLIDSVCEREGIYSVVPDYKKIGEETAKLFIAAGYTGFNYYCHEDRSETEIHLYHFTRTMRKYFSLTVKQLTGRSAFIIPEPPDWSNEFLEFILSDLNSAFLVTSTGLRNCLRNYIRFSGLERYPGIVGVYDFYENRDKKPGFSNWRIDPEVLAKYVVDTLSNVINGIAQPAITTVPVEWIDRGSVRRIDDWKEILNCDC